MFVKRVEKLNKTGLKTYFYLVRGQRQGKRVVHENIVNLDTLTESDVFNLVGGLSDYYNTRYRIPQMTSSSESAGAACTADFLPADSPSLSSPEGQDSSIVPVSETHQESSNEDPLMVLFFRMMSSIFLE